MLGRILAIIGVAAYAATGASGVNAAPGKPTNACQVVAGEAFLKDAGGAGALCSSFERAISARAPNVRYAAEVRVLSKSALTVRVVANGRTLPEQHYAVMDRDLNPGSIKRFGEAVADAIAQSGKSG